MEFEAFIHGVLASTQPAAGDDASRTPNSNSASTGSRQFNPVRTAKIAFYATITAATAIASLTAIPAFAAESTSSIQNLLANKGFYSGEIDGIEGDSTKQAIIKAQQFYGLNTDGVVGEQTLIALQDNNAESSEALTIAANISVSDLQALLAKRGFYKGAVDGVLGSSTQAAIVEAQRFYGLTPDGIVGNKTIEALEADKNTPNVATSSFTEDDVINLQKLLTSRGFYSGPISGFIGELTKEAIFKAQKFYGLTEDGVPGQSTLAALEADSEYKKSAKTEDVRSIQSLLSERGFYKGEIDGVLGEATKEAIRDAQKSYGLTVDGVAGSETVSALNGSKSRKISTRSTATDRAPAKTATKTNAVPAKTAEKTAAKTTAKTSPATRAIATKPSTTKPEVSKTVAAKPAPKAEKPAESAVTVKPSTTKTMATTATKPSTAHPETNKTESTKVAAKPSSAKPEATKTTAAKPATKPAITSEKTAQPSPAKPATVEPLTPLAEVTQTVAATKPAPTATKPTAQPAPAKPAPEAAIKVATATKPTEATTTASASSPTVNTKSSASKNVQVSELQSLLTTRGFFTGSSTGVMDNETKNAIVRAQSFYGLTPADGELSSALVDSLNRDPFIAKDN
jgi:peptidoglycan hydrolase-like protein with peptidoglycan-binding domain